MSAGAVGAARDRPDHLDDAIGLFGPDSVSWRIDRELVVLAGGSCALLMQAAHPSVAAGVALGGSGMGAAAAGRTGGPQPFADEDDEPDLADAENPFAGPGEQEPVPANSVHDVPVDGEPDETDMEPGSAEDADWVNGPVEDIDDEELKASGEEETAAEDWINGPSEDEAF